MIGFYLTLIDRKDDKDKFEQLYLIYKQDMYKMAYSILKNSADAEDVVHESFMIILKKLNNISEIKCPQTRAYLIIIVKNLALKKYNDAIKHISDNIDDMEFPNDINIEEDFIQALEIEELKTFLLKLPDDYYNILYLKYYMRLSILEIAESLDITYENAKKRLHRAKSKLISYAKEAKISEN